MCLGSALKHEGLFYTLFTHHKSVPGKLLSMGVFDVDERQCRK